MYFYQNYKVLNQIKRRKKNTFYQKYKVLNKENIKKMNPPQKIKKCAFLSKLQGFEPKNLKITQKGAFYQNYEVLNKEK